jgi:predicted dehydrogenase
MLAGKDVYCEKPISHNIVEGRAMVNAAKKLGRVVQVGTQQRSADHFREAIALVRSGVLGRIVETQTWNCEYRPPIGSPVDAPAPDYVDYDLWLGPAPVRPFNPNRFHYNWHWFWDYGGSNLTNWNVHLQDIVHLAMNAWSPRSVAMTGFLAHPGENRDTPDTGTATYEFDTPEGPFWQTYTMRVTNRYAPTGSDGDKHGILFCGRKATLVVDRGGWKLMPEKDSGLEPKEVQGADFIMRHIANFLECVKTRGTPASGIESMHLTTAACHLACISYRVGRRIYWDAQNEKIFRDRELKVVDDEANTLLGRDHRKPWILPQVF